METKTESKYERLRKIGTGSYGVVFKCVNRQNGQIVAIKRYSENDTDPIIRKIAMREVRMLRQLKHPNLINLIEVFRRKRRLHLVFDYCELTVLDVIEKYSNNCPLNLIKKIIWQTVNGINYCHTHNCIHRDIKPENILINQAGVVKLCDFGFARNFAVKPAAHLSAVGSSSSSFSGKLLLQSGINSAANKQRLQRIQDNTDYTLASADKENSTGEVVATSASSAANGADNNGQALTEYVATRWYRAPELLIGEVYYDIKIDIWAIGCVAAELMRGEPIWPGKTDLDQLCIIKNSLGYLTSSQTHTLLTQSIYDQASIERLLDQSPSSSDSLDRKLPSRVGQSGVDFVSACLRMDPARRPTSEELLKHAYIHSVRMTQFIKEANSTPMASRQLSAAIPTLNGAPPVSYGHLPTITKGRSNSQALKLITSTASGGLAISSGGTTNTTISSVLPFTQPTRRKLILATINSDQPLHSTSPNKTSSIPLPITKTPLHNSGGGGGMQKPPSPPQVQPSKQQQQQQIAPQTLKHHHRYKQQQQTSGGANEQIGNSPVKYKRRHPVNYNRRKTVLDWNQSKVIV